MFFVENLKNTTKYKENKNHLNPATITLFKTTFPGFKSVIGWAQRHFWMRYMKKCPEGQGAALKKIHPLMFCTCLGRDSAHSSDCAIVQGYKDDFKSSTALMPPLVKALGGILKSCQIILFLGAPASLDTYCLAVLPSTGS